MYILPLSFYLHVQDCVKRLIIFVAFCICHKIIYSPNLFFSFNLICFNLFCFNLFCFNQFRVGSDARCSWDEIEFEDEIIIGTLPLVIHTTPRPRVQQPMPNPSKPVSVVVPLSATPSEKDNEKTVEGKTGCYY